MTIFLTANTLLCRTLLLIYLLFRVSMDEPGYQSNITEH